MLVPKSKAKLPELSRTISSKSSSPLSPMDLARWLLISVPFDLVLYAALKDLDTQNINILSFSPLALPSLLIALSGFISRKKNKPKILSKKGKIPYLKLATVLMCLLIAMKPFLIFWQVARNFLVVPIFIAGYAYWKTSAEIKEAQKDKGGLSDQKTLETFNAHSVLSLYAARAFSLFMAISASSMSTLIGVLTLATSDLLAVTIILGIRERALLPNITSGSTTTSSNQQTPQEPQQLH